jgi:hypothetical protein
MNTVQKVGLFVGVSLECVALFLHAPWHGYDTENKGLQLSWGYIAPETLDKPFLDWLSLGALTPWLGSVGYFLICVLMIAALTGLWVFLFRSTQSSNNS